MSNSDGAATASPAKGGMMGSGTVGGLMAFCDYLVDKGIGTASAVMPLKSAARQVFEIVEGTADVDEMEVRSLDVEEYLDRFQTKAMSTGRYKPDSISAYRSRFTRIMDYYTAYLTTSTVPRFKLRGASSAGGGSRKRQPSTDAATSASAAAPPVDGEPSGGAASGLISYPFPLQTGEIATLRLPLRLQRADAERLGTFIRTLVFEPQKQLAQGQQRGDENQE